MTNLDGLPIVGQGSEWFWAILQMIPLVVTGPVIWRQLRAQAATNAIQQPDSLYGRWHSGLFTYSEMELALHVKNRGVDGDTWLHSDEVLQLMEDVGHLWATGHVRLHGMASFSVMFISWWHVLQPVITELRTVWGAGHHAETERIVEALERQQGAAGLHKRMSQEFWCDGVIQAATARLTRERNWQAGILPQVPVLVSEASPA